MVAGLVSAGLGALGDIVGGFASNAMSAYQAKKLAQYQAGLNYEYSKKQFKYQNLNGMKQARKGLEKAGYNPMLAITSGQGSPMSASSSFSSNPSFQGADFSDVGSSAISNANAVKQQKNQDKLTESQVENYNADSQLKTAQALHEQFKQLNTIADTNLKDAEKVLTDKQATAQEKENAWIDKKNAEYIKRLQTQNEVDLANSVSNRIAAYASSSQAQASLINADTNAYDVKVNRPKQIQNQYDLGINTRSNDISLHGPLGIGVTVHDQGYKPKRSKKYK